MSKFYKKYGDPTKNEFIKTLKLWDVPTELEIGAIPKRVYCHPDFIAPMERFFTIVKDRNLSDQIITWNGCYEPRPIRGYEEKFKALVKIDPNGAMKYLSVHSWACAFDFNAAWNRLGREPTLSKEMIQAIRDAGLVWGGDFKRKDGMHCELKI